MVVATQDMAANRPGWLYSATFDGWFIAGITIIGILSAVIVTIEPSLFWPILMLDLWILGYQHVISTYTRLCFDKQSFKEHQFLIIWLPMIVLAAVWAIGNGIGVWALLTIYFYWQWFHYTRQSWGVSQAYRRKEGAVYKDSELFSQMVLYSVPLTGILYRMWQSPDTYFGFALWTPDIPFALVAIVGATTIGIVGTWAYTRFVAWTRGQLPIAHTAYMVSHIAIFAVGYILIEDVTFGWLAINIWHNAQYIMFVWVYNNKRYENKDGENASFIAKLSQRKNWKRYFIVCLGLSTAVYASLILSEPLLALIGLAPMVIIYQAINFHHYIVDSIIWKSKKKPAKA
ncbi:MAG: hypothetical protein KI785_10170 [Devosiaceae bacterium]|nr:hypothetical protein [Devosiaceae bacterium MH13]